MFFQVFIKYCCLPLAKIKDLCIPQTATEGMISSQATVMMTGGRGVAQQWSSALFLCHQTKLLKMASQMLEKEKQQKKHEREATLSERLPALQLSGLSTQDLQVFCRSMRDCGVKRQSSRVYEIIPMMTMNAAQHNRWLY